MYHVIARGINKEPIFKQKREKNNFKRLLVKHLKDHDIEIFAYVTFEQKADFFEEVYGIRPILRQKRKG